jgi:hypothetical protein
MVPLVTDLAILLAGNASYKTFQNLSTRPCLNLQRCCGGCPGDYCFCAYNHAHTQETAGSQHQFEVTFLCFAY